MCIGIQRKPSGEVPQHAGYRLDVDTILEGDSSEGVSQIMESDLRDACPFQHPLQHIVDAVRGYRTAVGRWEHILVIGLCFLLFQNFYRLW